MTDPTDRHEAYARTVRDYFGLIDAGDLLGSVALFTPDAVYHRPGHAPMVGQDRIAHFYRKLRPIRSGAHTLDAVIVDDRGVATHGGFRGVGLDGNPIDLRFADFFEFDAAGGITRRETYFSAPLV
ncbi:nuclear transport factor 2 family protein [Micromonospora sp. WMMD882]|uniref:nuclear transport factor 2 family protein n=1 Tax=Micromonospora sp. WMMD882 TaxID=3015151 RepID=UPI00248C188A|nr:nuclear transport factor 2 family protein [Micromonospora sp. WMMD882]WBB80956.1 nuclear transport factor 2 family protein [Micromonospora sp. WMMD882]